MSIMTQIRDNWCRFQGELFPEIRDAVGPLHKDHQRFVMALGIICPENFVLRISQRGGRPICDRINLLRAFIAKAIWNIPTTRALFEHLKVDRQMRNQCGWVLPGEIPSESTFSRAFAEFAESDIAGQMHEALVKEFVGDRIVGHVSRDSTAIPAREKPAPKRSRKPSSFSSRGHGRFLSFPDDGDVAIDEARVKDAAKWDGLHSILIHGADDLDAQPWLALLLGASS